MIQDFKGKHPDRVAVIVGNGPSLDETPLAELAEKYITFGANKIYDSAKHADFSPTYWTCVDVDMLHDCIPWMVAHPEYSATKFVPREFPLPGANLLNVQIGKPFSTDAGSYVVLGGTVTVVNLQLAFYMGVTTALLVGVDHRYPKRSSDGMPGSKFVASVKDDAHFTTRSGPYFTPGHIYNRPELAGTAAMGYPVSRRTWEQHGRRIVNLTPDTALDVFERGKFAEWLK